ncbi:GNAT family N-acetyltransferase [Actinophytocola sp.]|uniref:GNAT family N-acetyltransferase n=1 Tax=Actinophytocola sp. TaxID=1872138 RepID=UPI002D800584|nr:GNAT family N-acetyltransferase [Actinophytocola sp.]HET9140052.1 GNAT family N-acetyltransferase [Actinophytocola sp.]
MWTYDVVSGGKLDIDEAAAVYRASTLAQRRPVHDRPRFTEMIRQANLIVTARAGDRLIGVARSMTDWSYTTYLSDLCVDVEFQRRGIGRELIRRTQDAAPLAKIVLLSAPDATEYYPHIGFTRHHSAWVLPASS